MTIKYDTNGTQLWAKFYNGPSGHWDRGEALSLDSSGNVYVAGYSQGTKPSGALFDEFLTIKYDGAGNEQWVRRRSTAQIGDQAYRIAVDSDGNAYVTGEAYAVNNSVTTQDLITVKYSPSGQELWASRFIGAPGQPGIIPLPNNPISSDSGGIALDPFGSVYVFGTNQSTGVSDYLLLKYDPATGTLVWSRGWNGGSDDYARDMAIDAGGNVYLTGETWDDDFNSATSDETWDAATVNFDSEGNLVWARIYRGFPGKVESGRTVSLDGAGNIYVGAYSAGFANADTALIKYSPDGAEQWVYRYDNPEHSSDSVRDMAVDAVGNIYFSGTAIMTNAGGTLTGDLVTVKLAPASGPINSPPQVSMAADWPTGSGRNLIINAYANDSDGIVGRVDFYDGTTFLGSDTTAPFSFQWNNAPLGTHAIVGAATDNAGAMRSSETLGVNVTDAAPSPSPTPAQGVQLYHVTDLGSINTNPATGSTTSKPGGINSAGQVAGYSSAGTTTHAARFTNGLVEDLGTIPGGDRSTGVGINDLGHVVGDSEYSVNGGSIRHAALFKDGTVTDLGFLPNAATTQLAGVSTTPVKSSVIRVRH